ncbi:MAG TPA: proton-conducting transporter membrane subunit [Polyangiaceae bacterium LLY-WYZ-14_1]|nr:proton-conducting transporter membrane subunit [Polyangiaceae bacterium LLY-WYZ-14_1]
MIDLTLLLYLAPLLLFAAGVAGRLEPGRFPTGTLFATRAATLGAFGIAIAAAVGLAIAGPRTSAVLGIGEVGLALRLDALSASMFLLVTLVGAIVVEFSRNYLDGDDRQGAFLGGLCTTVGAVVLLVTAGNLQQLVLAWVGTSLALHQLLVFYRERPGARIAARKKFIVARAGDLCLVGAAILVGSAFGTTEIAGIQEAARSAAASGEVPAGVGAAAFLLVIAAALKSAMFPTHGWLLEVMETPTPVSALLHAGLINAGTFLVARFGDVVLLHSPSLWALMFIGGFTALFASTAMVAQNSVKVSLAYSSAAHMGFMLMLCGLGAYTVAILHLIAHSFYKAHAFLSSGSVAEYIRALGGRIRQTQAPSLGGMLLSLACAGAVFLGLGLLLGAPLAERPANMALGVVFVMAISQLFAGAFATVPSATVMVRTVGSALAVALAFFTLEAGAAWILAPAVPLPPEATPATGLVIALVIGAFVFVSVFQARLPALIDRPFWRGVYVHLKNGFYANTLFDRLVGTYR